MLIRGEVRLKPETVQQPGMRADSESSRATIKDCAQSLRSEEEHFHILGVYCGWMKSCSILLSPDYRNESIIAEGPKRCKICAMHRTLMDLVVTQVAVIGIRNGLKSFGNPDLYNEEQTNIT